MQVPVLNKNSKFLSNFFPKPLLGVRKSATHPLHQKIAIYLTSVIKPCMAVGKLFAVAVFLAGRDCQILQIERNAFTLSFLSRRDLQILLVQPAKNPKLPNFGDQHTWVIIDGFFINEDDTKIYVNGVVLLPFRGLKMAQ